MAEIDLLPQILDLKLYAGDGAQIRFTITDTDDVVVPLTGTVEAEIRIKRPDPDPAVAEFAVDMTDALDGIILISLTGDQTRDLILANSKFKGVWDMQWTPTGSEPRTLVQGKVECSYDVSR